MWSVSLHVLVMLLPEKMGIHVNGSEELFGTVAGVILFASLIVNFALLRQRKPFLLVVFNLIVVCTLNSLLACSILCQLAPYAVRI